LALQVWADRYNKGSLHTDYQLHYKWPSKEAYTAAAAAAAAPATATTTAATIAPTATVPAPTAAAAQDNSNNNEFGDHRSVRDAPHGGESPVPNGQTNNDSNQQQQQQQADTDVRNNNNNNNTNNTNNNSVQSRGDRDSLDELYGNVNSAAAGYASDTESAAAPATSLRGDTPSRDPLHAVELAAEHDAAAQQFTQRARADHVRELLRDVTYVSEQVRTAALCAALL
jgi:hypothetical protein